MSMIEKAIEQIRKLDGYKIYRNPQTTYIFVVTPLDNVLYIQKSQFTGYDIALQYRPSVRTGSGCACHKGYGLDGYRLDFTLENMQALEWSGLCYARELHADLYGDSEQFFAGYWDNKNIVEVNAA